MSKKSFVSGVYNPKDDARKGATNLEEVLLRFTRLVEKRGERLRARDRARGGESGQYRPAKKP